MNNYTRKETTVFGDTFYYNDKDQYHRTDGPAVEYANGSKVWWVNGDLHRTDGPAVEWANGGKEWYVNGKRHRTDGPAVEHVNGDKRWFIDGKYLTEEEFNKHPLVVEYRLKMLLNEVLEEK